MGSDAEVTEADREKARSVIGAWALDWHGVANLPEQERAFLHGLIASAVADERAKAQAPFLRLAAAVRDGWKPSVDRLADAMYLAATDPPRGE